jgi:hypothetical protein
MCYPINAANNSNYIDGGEGQEPDMVRYFFQGMMASKTVEEYVRLVRPSCKLPEDLEAFNTALAALDALIDGDHLKCEHCHKQPAIFTDYRGIDVISKYRLCLDCSSMSDAEFFGIEPQTPSGEKWHNPDDIPITCDACHEWQPEEIQERRMGTLSLCGYCASRTDDELEEFFNQTPGGELEIN